MKTAKFGTAWLICMLLVYGAWGQATAVTAVAEATNAPVRSGVVVIPPGVTGPRSMAVQKRMQEIIIPKVEFVEANVTDVVKFLSKVAEAADRQEGKKEPAVINFILNLRGRKDVPTVTLTAREVSLQTVLRVVTEITGLRYYIEDNVVMIVPRETEGE